ncbi:ATP-dependent rRNA helicase spb4 [Saxophila tyrrhenica]|uniref:serine--tRNA ligase n=1 Tax=Saxophila tyrrhenica TaxID=1690608 RepID=A0AAV9PPL1_9PEZI|nr:ATP-dependent rRNA helicase spb4 [Saxophila tyrrhenica]
MVRRLALRRRRRGGRHVSILGGQDEVGGAKSGRFQQPINGPQNLRQSDKSIPRLHLQILDNTCILPAYEHGGIAITMATDTESVKKQPKSFEALTPELSSWILDFTQGMNFSRTTPVQGMAIPLLMGNKDLVVEAVTGSGKTLSFLIPIVERLLKAEDPNRKGHVRSIVVAPTKELASQIYDVLKGLLQYHTPSAAKLNPPPEPDSDDEDTPMSEMPPGPYIIPQLLIGGRTKLPEDIATFAELNPNVLIGTPKRLSEVLQSSKVVLKRHWFDLLVLDEADRLLDPNFQPDLQKILELVPKDRRTGLFSASVSQAVNELVRVGMRYPFKISARVRSQQTGALDKRTPESLKLCYIVPKPTKKIPTLKRVLQERAAEKSIVYVSTRAGVDYWSHVLPSILAVSVFPLHGDHKAEIRAKNLIRFRDCQTPAILLTTDVLARGIDIPDIDLVIQLDPPSQPKDFIHRCGRSGRAGKRGMAITFLSEGTEEDYIKYLEIQGTKVEPLPNPPEVADEEADDVVRQIRSVLTQKRELHDRSQKAFVSWVQAYNKTLPGDVFDIRRLAWREIGRAWGLLRWPKMPELRRYLPQAFEDRKFGLEVPDNIKIDDLKYADKVREGRRQEMLAARARGEKPQLPSRLGGAAADQRRKKENAWSVQKDAKALRETRRERKEVRRKAEKVSKMSEAEMKEAMQLEDLVAKVREQHAREEESFEGFARVERVVACAPKFVHLDLEHLNRLRRQHLSMKPPYICRSCLSAFKQTRSHNAPINRPYTRPSFASKPILNLKHMRQNPGLYEQNCLDRNYPAVSRNAWKILDIHNALVVKQKETLDLRRKNNELGKSIQRQAGMGDDAQGGGAGGTSALIEEAKRMKEDLRQFEVWEGEAVEEMLALGLEVPNLSEGSTPVGKDAVVLAHINEPPNSDERTIGRSHVDIGKELGILDFESSATTSGWGWYFLQNEGALLEQALVQYALEVAMKRGWKIMTPPSLVYEHIASACGFMPRDQNGETQRYEIASDQTGPSSDKPSLVLAGTAEIPFAGSQANKTMTASELPLKVIGPSRCYRAEAGARGVDTKGLYRVHEFTKVEMFAWTAPATPQEGRFGSGDEEPSQSDIVFEEMLAIQQEIISGLGLHAQIVEMPSTDLGAAAARKVDIEASFPSRKSINGGYGELTSASICTDYQTRRLGTRLKFPAGGALGFPHTLNGTALAVPRVIACILENGWNENDRTVTIPECLRKWVPGQAATISGKGRKG